MGCEALSSLRSCSASGQCLENARESNCNPRIYPADICGFVELKLRFSKSNRTDANKVYNKSLKTEISIGPIGFQQAMASPGFEICSKTFAPT